MESKVIGIEVFGEENLKKSFVCRSCDKDSFRFVKGSNVYTIFLKTLIMFAC